MTARRAAFVTGGAGFIGSHLVEALLARGLSVTAYDNLGVGRESFLEQALGSGARLVVADLLDPERLQVEMAGHDEVWHLAASSDIRGGSRSTRLDLEQGTIATCNVLEAARRVGVRRILFSSSSVVYGEPRRLPTPEDYGPLCPISLYGAAKLAAEGLLTAFSHCFGLQCYIFRFANVVGPRATHGILVDLAEKLRRDPGELEVLGDGRQRKSYLTVKDCVEAMIHVAEHATDPVNIYNLGCGDDVAVSRIAQMVVDRWAGGRARLRYTGTDRGWPGDVPRMLLDPARLNTLGWRASRTSEEAVALAIEALSGDPG
jgi:UDP-glucose 4-epimerase